MGEELKFLISFTQNHCQVEIALNRGVDLCTKGKGGQLWHEGKKEAHGVKEERMAAYLGSPNNEKTETGCAARLPGFNSGFRRRSSGTSTGHSLVILRKRPH